MGVRLVAVPWAGGRFRLLRVRGHDRLVAPLVGHLVGHFQSVAHAPDLVGLELVHHAAVGVGPQGLRGLAGHEPPVVQSEKPYLGRDLVRRGKALPYPWHLCLVLLGTLLETVYLYHGQPVGLDHLVGLWEDHHDLESKILVISSFSQE